MQLSPEGPQLSPHLAVFPLSFWLAPWVWPTCELVSTLLPYETVSIAPGLQAPEEGLE